VSMQVLVFHYSDEWNRDLSYHHGWARAFVSHKKFEATFVNLARRSPINTEYLGLFFGAYDAFVVLHSVFSNACLMPRLLQYYLGLQNKPVVYFIGNEYKLMPEKMRFCERIGVSLLVTQVFHSEVVDLYKKRLGCSVESIPGGGLDPNLFPPGPSIAERIIDVGFRGNPEPSYFGHQERETLVLHSRTACRKLGYSVDMSMNSDERFVEGDWSKFLRRCKSMIGSYSGYDYFQLDDAIRKNVNAFERANPSALFDDVYKQFFKGRPAIARARMLSGRHIEAAGSKTPQLLLEGEYSGFLKPDIHYIPVRTDYSNLCEALEKVRDVSYCDEMANRAYAVAINELTFERHIDRLHDALARIS